MSQSNILGEQAENMACEYLTQQGLELLDRNYRCGHGEIDLIMQEGEFLVFVEVRYRLHKSHGSPLESVTRHKQIKLIKAATHYLQRKKLIDKALCRFDVIALDNLNSNSDLIWIKDAFQVQ